ncbi:MAG TPA: hypothetical protein VKZ49_14945 [Polyangiaceae bacterium]|nr:hypothetical protein [Polyangiaceae bacterium]
MPGSRFSFSTVRGCRNAALAAHAAVALACASGSAPPAAAGTASGAASEGLERYLPLPHDTVYVYDTLTETGDAGVLIMRVRRTRPGVAELGVAGRARRLELSADAIAHATGGYLLKAPLELGRQYQGSSGTVRITAVDRAIQVPAGSFLGCLETVEQSPSPPRSITTIFCPHVGIVQLDVSAEVEGELSQETATLKSFGPAVNLE